MDVSLPAALSPLSVAARSGSAASLGHATAGTASESVFRNAAHDLAKTLDSDTDIHYVITWLRGWNERQGSISI